MDIITVSFVIKYYHMIILGWAILFNHDLMKPYMIFCIKPPSHY